MEYIKVARNWVPAALWRHALREALPGPDPQADIGDQSTSKGQPGNTRVRAKSKRAKKLKKLKKQAKAETKAAAAAKVAAEEEKKARAVAFENASPECSICTQSFPGYTYPRIGGCDHEPETCERCLEAWVDSQLNNTIVEDGIRCPSICDRKLSFSDLKGKIASGLYEKLEITMVRSALRKMPSYRDCMAQNCKSGQFHDTKTDGNILRCNECGFRVCTVHELPFHDGETCKAYDERKKVIPTLEEATKRTIARLSKPCPNCAVNIEKNGGCDEMICNRCQHIFCYDCSAPYHGPTGIFAIGNSAHSESCAHYRATQHELFYRTDLWRQNLTREENWLDDYVVRPPNRQDLSREQRQSRERPPQPTSQQPGDATNVVQSLDQFRAELDGELAVSAERQAQELQDSLAANLARLRDFIREARIERRDRRRVQSIHSGTASQELQFRTLMLQSTGDRESYRAQSTRVDQRVPSDGSQTVADIQAEFNQREAAFISGPTRNAASDSQASFPPDGSFTAQLLSLRARFDDLQQGNVHVSADNQTSLLDRSRALHQEQRVLILNEFPAPNQLQGSVESRSQAARLTAPTSREGVSGSPDSGSPTLVPTHRSARTPTPSSTRDSTEPSFDSYRDMLRDRRSHLFDRGGSTREATATTVASDTEAANHTATTTNETILPSREEIMAFIRAVRSGEVFRREDDPEMR